MCEVPVEQGVVSRTKRFLLRYTNRIPLHQKMIRLLSPVAVRGLQRRYFFYEKFVTLFTDSYKELKSVRTITTAAMLAAIAIILGMFSIDVGSTIRIGFSVFRTAYALICSDLSWRHLCRRPGYCLSIC